MTDVALKTEIFSGAAPGATVKVPGLTANNVPFTAFDVTPAAQAALANAVTELGALGATETIDVETVAQVITGTVNSDCTITINSPSTGQYHSELQISAASGGPHALTFAGTNVSVYPAGVGITVPAGGDARIISIEAVNGIVQVQAFADASNSVLAAGTAGNAVVVGSAKQLSDSGVALTTLANASQVSGGEITAGTETSVRSFSPADVKSMIDTHAPSGGTALNIIDVWTPYVFSATSSHDSWAVTAISSGTAISTTTSEFPGQGLELRASASADSGHSFRQHYTTPKNASNWVTAGLIKTPSDLTNALIYFGVADAATAVNASAPTDGMFIQINGTTLKGRNVASSSGTDSGTTYTLSTSTVYWVEVEFNLTTPSAIYRVRNSTGSVVWTQTVTSNIPSADTVFVLRALDTAGSANRPIVKFLMIGIGTIGGMKSTMGWA